MIHPYYVLFFTLIFILFRRSVQCPQLLNSLLTETDDCECGKYDDVSVRIVGGEEADPHEYPWMVAIIQKGSFYCGGSLINDRYVLTAGHCLKWSKKENLRVVVGLHDRILFEKEGGGASILEIDEIIVHEDFTSNRLHDSQDIGLIRLKYPVTFTEKIWPLCLPTEGEDFSGEMAKVAGWGRVSQNGITSRLLKKANVKVISNLNCTKNEIIGKHIKDSMLCAYEFETDACQGDSGGPLILERDDGTAEQIGIVSWGMGCAEPEMPGVYTRVTSFMKWIALNTRDAIYCKNPA